MSDPSKIAKYAADPKLGPILAKLMSKGGMGGMPGMGGMGGMGGM